MDPDHPEALAFVEHYYKTFDLNRDGLVNLYQERSVLSIEGQKVTGAQAIVSKHWQHLPFQQCTHNISTIDCQVSPNHDMVVFVNGSIQVPGKHPLNFSQTFYLVPMTGGSFYVENDIFRLNRLQVN